MALQSKIRIIERKRIEDHRGWFLKTITGKEEGLPAYTGEVYITVANPDETKGAHFHPQANEWFTLLTGNCNVLLHDMETGERLTLQMDATKPYTLYVPNNIAHAFVNASNENQFMLLAYSDQLYDPQDTIPFTF